MSIITKENLIIGCLFANSNIFTDYFHLQKFLFLFQERSGLEEKPFTFTNGDYGPVSDEVFDCLEKLFKKKDIARIKHDHNNEYCVTIKGAERSKRFFRELDQRHKNFLYSLTKWVCSLELHQLVNAICKEYPEFKKTTIFHEEENNLELCKG